MSVSLVPRRLGDSALTSRQPTENPPCQGEACTLQTCLNRYQTSPEKCDDQLLGLYRCCAKMYDMANEKGGGDGKGKGGGREADSSACPIKSVTFRKLKQLEGR